MTWDDVEFLRRIMDRYLKGITLDEVRCQGLLDAVDDAVDEWLHDNLTMEEVDGL